MLQNIWSSLDQVWRAGFEAQNITPDDRSRGEEKVYMKRPWNIFCLELVTA